MVFCGKEQNRRGRLMGSPYQCFKKGFGSGMHNGKPKQARQAPTKPLNELTMESLRILAKKHGIKITKTINKKSVRKTKSELISELQAKNINRG